MKKRRSFLKSLGAGLAALGVSARNAGAKPASGPHVWANRPEKYTTDVLVCGGGPAGIGAAIGAARTGAKTMLVENHAFLGGVASYGIGMPINQMRPMETPRSVVHEQVIEGLLRYGDHAVMIGPHQLWCNVDYLRAVVLEALDAVQCKYLTHTRVVDTIVQNDRVAGVVIATKQGLVRIGAKMVIDGTGDADIACYSGAETMIEYGNLSPMTLLINVTNINHEAARKASRKEIVKKAKHKYPLLPDSWGLNRYNSHTTLNINHPGTKVMGQVDGTNPDQLTAAEAHSRRQAVQMIEAMREFGGPEFKDIELARTSAQVGVRETRRVKGSYILTEEDAMAGQKFDDVIAWRSGFLDIGHVRLSRMKIHDVPYRAIVPEKMDGLFMTGRCISATHVAASAGKSMGNCVATGHAAGLAATLCIEKNCQPRDLSVALVQNALRKDGVDLDMGGKMQDALKSGASAPPRKS